MLYFDNLSPGFFEAYHRRALIHLCLGDVKQARRDAEMAVRVGAGAPEAGLPLLLVDLRAGDTAAALRALNGLRLEVRNPSAPRVGEGVPVAIAFVALGDADQALDLLERLPGGRKLWLRLRWPDFDPIRADPRFQRLVEESRPPGAP